MEYLCFTSKHIDGFCMWDTRQTTYNIMNTPYRRDVLGMLAEACHRRRFPLCVYYSCADMHHPNYPNSGRNYELPAPDPGDQPDLPRYLEFVRAQVQELCTNYGELHGFWWDANMTGTHDPSFNQLIRRLQPNALINNRGYDEGDTRTPEREYEHARQEINAAAGFTRAVEACNSVGVQSWGYRRDEDYYTPHHLIDAMDTILAKGGNYLLNVGPDGLGEIPPRSAALLRRIGRWYTRVREAFDNAEPASQLIQSPGVFLTRKGTTLYVHIAGSPQADAVFLPPFEELPRSAVLLNTGVPVETSIERTPNFFRRARGVLRLRNLPMEELANEVAVIRLEFDKLPAAAGSAEQSTVA